MCIEPFCALEPETLADVRTLDAGLRSLNARFLEKANRRGVGPEMLVAHVVRIRNETDLIRTLMVGLENGIDKDELRKLVLLK